MRAFLTGLFLGLLVLCVAPQAQAACTAPCTKAQITTDINANWPDNVIGTITPALLRSTVSELLNSYLDVNGASTFVCPTHQVLTAIATLSSYTCAQVSIADISGWGTGVATALGVNVGTAGAFVVNGGALGTPSSGVGTNLTGTAAGLTAGNVTTNANLTGAVTSIGNATLLGSFTSANLRGALTDESGTGAAYFQGGDIGTPSAGVGTNLTALNASNLGSGTVPAARGGAGAITGALKGSGAGVVSQAATTDLSDVTALGAWTPADGSGAALTFTGVQANYTKIGNMVFAYASLTYPATANGSNATINGLPVTVPNTNYARGPCRAYSSTGSAVGILLSANTTGGLLVTSTGAPITNASMTGATVILTCTYPAA